MKHSFCFFLLFSFISCATYIADYDISLQSVEKPVDAAERYGKRTVIAVEGPTYEDEFIEIHWLSLLPGTEYFSFILTNRTEHSIKVIWDEAVIIDEEGLSYRVVHSGIKVIDTYNLQPPGIVARQNSLQDVVIPTETILPTILSGRKSIIAKKLKNYIGNTYQILLPLEIADTINEYIFIFRIDNARALPYKK